MKLTINKLKKEAIKFCKRESNISHEKLVGITDGKAVGTYIEHKFEDYLKSKYDVTIGSSAKGVDLPDTHINTDIKVTSITKPQSSSPFKNIEQKIYGLGYNLLIFVYEKTDYNNKCYLDFKNCIFLKSENTGDYNLTKVLREQTSKNISEKEIIEILKDTDVPGDAQTLKNLAKKIILNPPKQGYLTISNAFQWRLRYNNIINSNMAENVHSYENNGKEQHSENSPLFITDCIFEYLKNDLKISPDIIIEPISKTHNFLTSANKFFPNTEFKTNNTNFNSTKTNDSNIEFKMNANNRNSLKLNKLDKDKYYLIIENLIQMTNDELFNFLSNDATQKTNLRKSNLTQTDSPQISYKIMKMIKLLKNNNITSFIMYKHCF